jgi:hypothetical protein
MLPSMTSPVLPLARDFMQQAWVVDDLEASMRAWTATCSVGPFFVLEHVPMSDLRYRGKPAELDCTIALAQAGRTQIELIVQHCDNPSVYRDLVPKGRGGFHHMALICDHYDRDLKHYVDAGFAVATSGSFGDTRFAYLDTKAVLGCAIELLEARESILEHFRMIADAASGWDGRDPVRPAF